MTKKSFKGQKKKKNKGPKGKRARAKAKLERQWGREPTSPSTTEFQLLRPGGKRSRMLQQKQPQSHDDDHESLHYEQRMVKNPTELEKTALFEDGNNNNNNDDNDESSSTRSSSASSLGEEDDDDDDTAHHYSTLMKAIQSSRNRHRHRGENNSLDHTSKGSEDDDGDDDDDESMNDDDDEQSKKTADDDDDDDEEEDAANSSSDAKDDADPFTERFSRDPLLPDNDEIEATLQGLHRNTVKITPTITTHNDDNSSSSSSSSLDVQVSKEMVDKLQLLINDDPKAQKRRSQKLMLRCFYREMLQRNFWKGSSSCFDPIQSLVFPMLSHYADILMTTTTADGTATASSSYRQIHKNRKSMQRVVVLHMLNHVWTSRSRIYRHNRRIQQQQQQIADDDHDDDDKSGGEDDAQEVNHDAVLTRDQGFTRPTVLVLLPTRSCCYDFVQTMLSLLDADVVVDNMDRFETEYGKPPTPLLPENEEEGDDSCRRRRKAVIRQKGPAWNELFGDDRNDDDDFKIGVQINLKKGGGRKRPDKSSSSNYQPGGSCSIKLFSDFFKSDIILASPLGLKMATSSSSSTDDEDSTINADFLSSIEICLVTRADVLLMQNWDHVNDVLGLLNQQPKSMNETDFSRVRQYMLAGQAAHWRQLIVLSEISDPCILSSFKRHAKSVSGVTKIKRRYPASDASLSSVLLPTRQVFQRVPCSSFANQSADRLKYFVDKILPQLERHKQNHTMIFIPSYFDFVSLRNMLLKRKESSNEGLDFVSVTEYSRVTEVSRGRARFLQGRKPLMLYTGRAHFFLRHAIKGVRHLIFFGLPEYPAFYSEHVNRLNEGLKDDDDGASESCLALFTKYDSHALERIVGSSNCSRMVKGEKTTFLFSS